MIIADTSGILSAIDVDSADHAACAATLRAEPEAIIVSPMVVAEVDYLLTKRFGVATANRFLTDVGRGAYRLAPCTSGDIDEAVTVNTQYAGLRLGVSDCMTIVLAKRFDTIRILTLDHRHFRAVAPLQDADAFVLLPADHATAP